MRSPAPSRAGQPRTQFSRSRAYRTDDKRRPHMRSWRWKFPPVLLGGLALALVALAPPAALGQVNEECNGFIDLDYDPPPVISVPPFDVNVRVTLGGGQIIGGPGSPMITYP